MMTLQQAVRKLAAFSYGQQRSNRYREKVRLFVGRSKAQSLLQDFVSLQITSSVLPNSQGPSLDIHTLGPLQKNTRNEY